MTTKKITDSDDFASKIRQVCFPCGVSANVLTCLKRHKSRPIQPCYKVSTYHLGKCDWCEEQKEVTEIRDFFYPDFKGVKCEAHPLGE